MKLKIDYHFHPNLPRNNKKALEKCVNIWKKFQDKGINIVLITEHAYKNPGRAFNLMNRCKQDSQFCFPGLECVTKEGIDLIVFSKNENIYKHEKLKAFSLPYNDLIAFVNSKNDLHAFVTHPYTLGLTSVLKKLGSKSYAESVNLLNAIEISNGSFDNLYFLIKEFPLKFFFKSKLENIKKNINLPKSEYPKKIIFLAVGSDAHYVEEIGNYYEISSKLKHFDGDRIFELITNNNGCGKAVHDISKKFSFFLLIRTGYISFIEFLLKKWWKIINKT